MADLDLFGNPVQAAAPKPSAALTTTEIGKLWLRGIHPATRKPVRIGQVCGTCRFFGPGLLCRFAEQVTEAGWLGCQLHDASRPPAANRPVAGTSSARAAATSRQAAGKVRAGSQKARALALFRDAPDGLTAFEAANLLGMSPNQTAARLGELRADGFLMFSHVGGVQVKRKTTPGCTGLVHYLTPAGVGELAPLQQT